MSFESIPAWLGSLLGAVVLGLFGFQTWKRHASATKLQEAQDSQQKEFLGIGAEQYRSLEKQFSVMEERYNNSLRDIRRLEDELAKAQRSADQFQIRMDAALEDAREWQKRAERAGTMLPREQIAGMFVQSQFLDEIEHRKAAAAAPASSYQDPFQTHVVYGRRATDKPKGKP